MSSPALGLFEDSQQSNFQNEEIRAHSKNGPKTALADSAQGQLSKQHLSQLRFGLFWGFFPPLGTIKAVSSKEHAGFWLAAGKAEWNEKRHPGCHQIHLLAEQHHARPAGGLGRANLELKRFSQHLAGFSSFPDNLDFAWNLSGSVWPPACLEPGPVEINDMENGECWL